MNIINNELQFLLFGLIHIVWIAIYMKYIANPFMNFLVNKFGHEKGGIFFIIITMIFVPMGIFLGRKVK